ncbi:neuronal-glial cell adhesion molecule-like isoform X2 [Zonotrichia albicollis]|uniref:neuronal-glial cell adhesion molecule-like isoform X2 n=1 Tax=Zonotrichia albicollis TaxID=44394 RepID=UPI003D80CFE3
MAGARGAAAAAGGARPRHRPSPPSIRCTSSSSPPELTEAPPEQLVVFPSDDAVLKCAASGHPAPRFRWTRDGRPFPSPSLSPAELAGVSVSPGGGTLVINASLAGRLQGRFRCEATNALGTAVSPESRVIAETPPQWPKEKVTPVTVEEGDPVVLPCEPPRAPWPPRSTGSTAGSCTLPRMPGSARARTGSWGWFRVRFRVGFKAVLVQF